MPRLESAKTRKYPARRPPPRGPRFPHPAESGKGAGIRKRRISINPHSHRIGNGVTGIIPGGDSTVTSTVRGNIAAQVAHSVAAVAPVSPAYCGAGKISAFKMNLKGGRRSGREAGAEGARSSGSQLCATLPSSHLESQVAARGTLAILDGLRSAAFEFVFKSGWYTRARPHSARGWRGAVQGLRSWSRFLR
jgi:hypothetical protein